MPIQRCYKNSLAGWRWGKKGRCYVGPGARVKALKQARAIKARGGNKKKMDAPLLIRGPQNAE